MTMTPLGRAAVGRDNNFNLLRMIAASAVLVSHAYPISSGIGVAEPLSKSLGMSLGALAVLTFFLISGFFISQSFDRSKSLVDFLVARALRIYPGLFGALLFTVFIVGPIFTTLEFREYITNFSTWIYVLRNLSLVSLQYGLVGVFQHNPYPSAINGSLWSLFFEVCCYALVATVGSFRLANRNWRFSFVLILYAVAYVSLKLADQQTDVLKHSFFLGQFHRLTLPFVAGMAFYQFRRLLPLNVVLCVVAIGAACSAYRGFWFDEVFIICWSYLVFYFGYLEIPQLKLYNHLGDYSYGMYIYAFPVEQSVAAFWTGGSPFQVIVLSLPATLVIAVLSWHFLEGPLVRCRPRLAASLERLPSRRSSTSTPRLSNARG
jgi:peptidoglycan/LPS O-acetylase OafA/YrhL